MVRVPRTRLGLLSLVVAYYWTWDWGLLVDCHGVISASIAVAASILDRNARFALRVNSGMYETAAALMNAAAVVFSPRFGVMIRDKRGGRRRRTHSVGKGT